MLYLKTKSMDTSVVRRIAGAENSARGKCENDRVSKI